MGILVSVYRSADIGYNCTLNGVSSQFNRLCVVNVDGPFEPTADCPAVLLESHHPGCVRLVPAAETEQFKGVYLKLKGHASAGGNFGSTSDSRFAAKCEELAQVQFYGAVAIHDRYE
jgi:hypothetical protein